ncbi:class I lanthipeptide [Chitinophaga nivalis]|uniref:Class I lanthipeptide n=1 Tax=Chitinophaga nivalis TaxID=2991709 RepID=A0ABT3ILA7_9BACT|nr:class I lanthipeptide [Chitinophaga nivalis]MCW3465553.1 class I lanthipeptide [Chitinophaga nivalis]MCW3484756.1 class I lanthipeptide [Chitinophaga nivalis]
MKKKKIAFSKKLFLDKVAIIELNQRQQQHMAGGRTVGVICISGEETCAGYGQTCATVQSHTRPCEICPL